MKKYLLLILSFMLSMKVGRAQDWANMKRYQADNQKLTDSAIVVKAVYMGDSITDYWINTSPDFFKANGYVDRGISGQTSPQMLLRFRQDVVALKPKMVLLLCGANDIAGNTGPETLEMIEDNIQSMTELAIANHILMILCSVLPSNKFGWKPDIQPANSITALNNWIKSYTKTQHLKYVDYYVALVDEARGMKAVYSRDGVHPNKEAYTVMEKLAKEAIER